MAELKLRPTSNRRARWSLTRHRRSAQQRSIQAAIAGTGTTRLWNSARPHSRIRQPAAGVKISRSSSSLMPRGMLRTGNDRERQHVVAAAADQRRRQVGGEQLDLRTVEQVIEPRIDDRPEPPAERGGPQRVADAELDARGDFG